VRLPARMPSASTRKLQRIHGGPAHASDAARWGAATRQPDRQGLRITARMHLVSRDTLPLPLIGMASSYFTAALVDNAEQRFQVSLDSLGQRFADPISILQVLLNSGKVNFDVRTV